MPNQILMSYISKYFSLQKMALFGFLVLLTNVYFLSTASGTEKSIAPTTQPDSARFSAIQNAKTIKGGYEVPDSWHTKHARQQTWWPQQFRRRQQELRISNWEHRQDAIAHAKALKNPNSQESMLERHAALRVQQILQADSNNSAAKKTKSTSTVRQPNRQ